MTVPCLLSYIQAGSGSVSGVLSIVFANLGIRRPWGSVREMGLLSFIDHQEPSGGKEGTCWGR